FLPSMEGPSALSQCTDEQLELIRLLKDTHITQDALMEALDAIEFGVSRMDLNLDSYPASIPSPSLHSSLAQIHTSPDIVQRNRELVEFMTLGDKKCMGDIRIFIEKHKITTVT
ncbi:hypothetical protein PMAYCL1PPCAC_30144, partial [Pristionchus mayeri]